MERIQKAMELARAQRSGGAGSATPITADASLPDPPPVVVPLCVTPSEKSAGRSSSRQSTFTIPLRREVLRERRLVLPEDRGAAAHAYRMLRAGLMGWIRSNPRRIIGVTSPSEAEGKTLTAVNVAMQLANEPGFEVTLVEFDLRRPVLAQLFDIAERPGVEAVLQGTSQLDDVTVGITGLERLRLVPAGRVATAMDSLAGPMPEQLLASLANRHSGAIVIVDLPPALLSSDVLTLVPSLDGVLVVASEGRTRRDDLRKLAAMLRDVRIIGTVLNQASEFERRAY